MSDEHRCVEPEVGAAVGEAPRVARERDDHDQRVTEQGLMVAHGDDVLLAGQAGEMPMQDEHDRAATVVAEAPRSSLVIDEGDVGKQVALVDHAAASHARSRRASSMPRWNAPFQTARTMCRCRLCRGGDYSGTRRGGASLPGVGNDVPIGARTSRSAPRSSR